MHSYLRWAIKNIYKYSHNEYIDIKDILTIKEDAKKMHATEGNRRHLRAFSFSKPNLNNQYMPTYEAKQWIRPLSIERKLNSTRI